ncbi:MAG TPA: ribonuclease Z [Cyclobacteriaceae bacterium]|nr:ribonuclease Z [Cyclobacteriaceae bacterium]
MAFQVTILGSSGALPAYGRFPSSQYLNIHHSHFLIDCGEGVQMQLKKFSVPFHKIDRIFVSHLHGDHYLGLMGLLFSMHLLKRTADLHLYGQRGLDEIITLQLKYSKSSLNFKIIFHHVPFSAPSLLHEDDTVIVHSIPLVHKVPCTGFLFSEKPKPRRIDKDKIDEGMRLQHIALLKQGKDVFNEDGTLLYKNEDYTLDPRPSYSYAYCSDTAYSPELVKQLHGVDLLYHEATFTHEHEDKATETFHSTASQAGRIARDAGVKNLIIGHFSARYKELDTLLKEASAEFPSSHLAIEGETFDLEKL